MRKSTFRRSAALGAVCILSAAAVFCVSPCTVLASETGYGPAASQETESYQAVDGGQIPEEKLSDSQIEYSELGSLIHKNNVSVKNISSALENQKRSYRAVRDSLRWEKKDAQWQQEDAEKEGDTDRYLEYSGYEAVYESAVKSYNQTLKSLSKASSRQSQTALEKQLTSAAQSLFLSWQSAAAQEEYLMKMEEVFRESYQNTCLKQQAGMVAEPEVLSAYHTWQSAADAASSVTSAKETVYYNLCTLLGTATDGSMELVPLEGTDLSRLEGLDLETGTEEALINNTSLSSTRKAAASTSADKAKKARTVGEMQEEVTLDMQALYSQLVQAKLSYDAAAAAWENGQIAWNSAQSKNTLGMLSREEYLQEEMLYLQKKAAFESADLSLLQALENYQWAARGI